MVEKEQGSTFDERYVVSLDVFEGPLDLLLHLINRHKLDIFDIPISFITSKYLEYLDLMKELNLNLASEYLEMAAHLTYMKSRMMLPIDPSDDVENLEIEQGPDPREELVRQLLEYQKYKLAAEELSNIPRMGRDTFARGLHEAFEPDQEIASPGLFSLMEALKHVLDRIGDDSVVAGEISITRLTVSTRIHQILDQMRVRKRMPFIELFDDHVTRSDVVVTFLAILEMTKLGLTKIHQASPETEIHITSLAEEIDANKVLAENYTEEE